MPHPAFTGDARAAAFIQREYEKLHQQNLFIPDPRYSEREAHQEAFRRFLVARQEGRV